MILNLSNRPADLFSEEQQDETDMDSVVDVIHEGILCDGWNDDLTAAQAEKIVAKAIKIYGPLADDDGLSAIVSQDGEADTALAQAALAQEITCLMPLYYFAGYGELQPD